jgi:hypothetical protein
MSKLLAIGGPAEGEMLNDGGYNDIIYLERLWKKWTFADYENPLEANFKQHTYRKLTLQFMDGDENLPAVWRKEIYVHSSLDNNAATERLREFLVITFIKMQESDDVK